MQDGTPIAPFEVSGSVDSYTYSDTGVFSIQQQTTVGAATLNNGAFMGSGLFDLLVVGIPSHPEVKSFTMQGVANTSPIDCTFMTERTDGSLFPGTVNLSPS